MTEEERWIDLIESILSKNRSKYFNEQMRKLFEETFSTLRNFHRIRMKIRDSFEYDDADRLVAELNRMIDEKATKFFDELCKCLIVAINSELKIEVYTVGSKEPAA
jgi:hypothetical protein